MDCFLRDAQRKYENEVGTVDAECQLTPKGSMVLTDGSPRALSRKEIPSASDGLEHSVPKMIFWCWWMNVIFLWTKKASRTKLGLGPVPHTAFLPNVLYNFSP